MNSLLIFISVCCFSVMSISIRLYQLLVPQQQKGILLFQAILNLCSGVLFFCSSGLGLRMSGSLWVMAVLFGVFAYVASACYALSMQKGPLSLSAILLSMSLIWPLLYSAVGNHEHFTGLQIVGVLLMLATLALSAISPEKGEQRRATLLWLVIALAAFFANGVTATQQKMTVVNYSEKAAMQMMGIGYLISTALFLTHYFVKAGKQGEEGGGICGFSMRDKMLVFGLSFGAGSLSFLGNLINGGLCAVVPGAILYPCVNGGLCLMTSVISFLFFKEKLTKWKALAMVTGITAIVLLNL